MLMKMGCPIFLWNRINTLALKFRMRALTGKPLKLQPDALKAKVVTFLEKYTATSIHKFKKYPPPVPTSRYKRTYTLRNSWKFKVTQPRSGIYLYIWNDTDEGPNASKPRYAHFVMGLGTQTWFHRRRWIPAETLFDRTKYNTKLRKLVNKHFREVA